MPDQVTSAFRRLVTAIREFTIAQRTIALIGVAVLVLGVAGLGLWLTKPSYTPLFTGLAASDASTIVEQLRGDSVPYELTAGGSTILVPEEFVYDQRLKAASAGLPSSSNGGYALLDDMGVTSSEFQQSVTYKRALEGELAATIQALKGVRTASVRLAIPKDTVFVSQKVDSTASVFVETDNGITLSTEQVQAIVHLTSASIDGMKPSNVAVVDASGTVLSAVGVGATGSADKQSSDYEGRVTAAVQSMLDRVVGPGNATVVVAADMSYESAERLEETFTSPEDNPALSESVDTETFSGGAGGTATGVLGPDNIAVPAEQAGDGSYTSESVTRNNAVNKVTENRIIPAGSITRQTVSVALNAEAAAGLNVPNISALVASAAGYNANRGDEVTVEVVAFNSVGAVAAAEALAAAEAEAAAERFAGILTTAIITAGSVIALVFALVLFLRRSKRQERESVDIGRMTDVFDAPTLPVQMSPTPAQIEFGPSGMAGGHTPGPISADHRRADIEALAQRDPRATADYLRGLMDDRQHA